MKTTLRLLAAAFFAAYALPCEALQLNWGSPGGTWVVDSDGDGVTSEYSFELGAFPMGFDPDNTAPDLWVANWMVFDAATYNPMLGLFTSGVVVSNQVTSNSTMPNVSTESFSGLIAYLWIRKGNQPIPGSEWLLVRADNWIFPTIGGDCCETGTLEWSISDLNGSNTPVWGNQGGVSGPGVHTYTSTSGLQTHTFSVPEPSTALLAAVAGLGLALRRRRNA